MYLSQDSSTKVIVNNIEKQKKSPSLYNSKSLETKDKYSVFLDGNHPILEINSNTI